MASNFEASRPSVAFGVSNANKMITHQLSANFGQAKTSPSPPPAGITGFISRLTAGGGHDEGHGMGMKHAATTGSHHSLSGISGLPDDGLRFGGSQNHVTVDQLENLRDEMKILLQEGKDNILSDALGAMNAEIKDLSSLVESLELDKEALKLEVRDVTSTHAHMDHGMSSMKTLLEGLQEQMDSSINDVLSSVRRDIEENVQKMADNWTRSLQQNQAMEHTLMELRRESSENIARRSSLNSNITKHVEEYQSFSSNAQGIIENLQNATQDLRDQLSQEVGQLKIELGDLRQEENSSIAAISADMASRIQAIEKCAAGLEQAKSEILSIPVRRVEWIVKNANQLVIEAGDGVDCFMHNGESNQEGKPVRCWFSPEFDACGASGLHLELQVFSVGLSENAEQQAIKEGVTLDLRVASNLVCKLLLWAPKGVGMHVKLYFGGHVVELNHNFDGVSPCSMDRSRLQDGINELSNTLRMGVEVLEVFQTRESATVPLANVRGAKTSSAAVTEDDTIPQGFLCLFNHVCPGVSQKLDAIENQLQLVQSRLLGRVEWVLQDASLLPDLFPQGSFLCSPVFTAGGIEGLQLVFFPSGEVGATSCWCSFYLYYPGRTQLQCWLWVGKQRKEISQVSKGRPGFFGRLNFSIFQPCVDRATDALMLAVEVCDVQCSGIQALACEPAPLAVPWPQQLAEPLIAPADIAQLQVMEEMDNLIGPSDESSDVGALSHWSHPQIFEHTTRLYGRAGRLAFQDVKTLPPIFSLRRPERLDEYGGQSEERSGGLWSYKPTILPSTTPHGYFKSSDLRLARPDLKQQLSVEAPRGELAALKHLHGSPRPVSSAGEAGRLAGEAVYAPWVRDEARCRSDASRLDALATPKKEPTRPLNPPQNSLNRAKVRHKADLVPLSPHKSGGPGASTNAVRPEPLTLTGDLTSTFELTTETLDSGLAATVRAAEYSELSM